MKSQSGKVRKRVEESGKMASDKPTPQAPLFRSLAQSFLLPSLTQQLFVLSLRYVSLKPRKPIIFNSDGQILLQSQLQHKKHCPCLSLFRFIHTIRGTLKLPKFERKSF